MLVLRLLEPQSTMREVVMTGRGWISMIRFQLLASGTVERDLAVTVRETYAA
jgi:hypothetical protein